MDSRQRHAVMTHPRLYELLCSFGVYFAMQPSRRKILLAALSVALLLVLALSLLVLNANRVLKHEIARRLGRDVSIGSIDLQWGKVVLRQIRLMRGDEPVIKADVVALRADFLGLLRGETRVSEIVIERPSVIIETDNKGRVKPLLPEATDKRSDGESSPKTSTPFFFNTITVSGGSLTYRDGRIASPPHVTRLEEISLRISDLSLPFGDTWSEYAFEALVPGKQGVAMLSGKGRKKFKSGDTEGKISLHDLDLTAVKPYYHKKGDAEVSKGTLDITMDLAVRSGMIRAPGSATIRNLEFRSGSGIRDTFMGVPRSLVVDSLRDGNGEIALDFVLEGDLTSPRFTIAEGVMRRLTVGLATRLGFSVLESGESAVVSGARGIGEIGRGLRGLGEELGKTLRK